MLINILLFLTGLALLALSSDRFVLAACAIAHGLGITPMVVGLTVVAVGTSAPEMLVSAMAARDGAPAMALGNAIGSNIANITLVVGVSALLAPFMVASETLRREFLMLFLVSALAWILVLDGDLSRIDGVILLLAMTVVLGVIVQAARSAGRRDPLRQEIEARKPIVLSHRQAGISLLSGLVLMAAASWLVVRGASGVARAFGVSDLVIGLTIVAVGTSLPELAASISSALRGQQDIVIGNVVGSNMFNLLPVLAVAGLISPFEVDPIALSRDFPIMAVLTAMLLFMCVGWRGPGRVTRLEGAILLASFTAYQGLLYVMRA